VLHHLLLLQEVELQRGTHGASGDGGGTIPSTRRNGAEAVGHHGA
jgi:hypothetical protein